LDLRRPGRYPVRVLGEGLLHRGILPSDVLVVDAAAEPHSGVVAIVMIGGEVLLGQLAWRGGQWFLRSSRPDRLPLLLAEDAEIWAVVVSLVRERV
jgi:DNA polymerase V